jgi:hypothetical protein
MSSILPPDAAGSPPPPPGDAWLWFGLFGACAAWSLQELLSYGLVARGCLALVSSGVAARSGATFVSAGLVLLGVVALLVAALAQRRIGGGRAAFMALGGVVVSGTFVLGLLANFAVLFLAPACG